EAAAPSFTAADTASRTVAQAIAQRLAFVKDSLAREPQPDSATADSLARAGRRKYSAGEDPDYAREMGWPVNAPKPLPGAILPDRRIVCYYGNPNSTRMGALGEYPRDEMLRRLQNEVQKWTAADPEHPAVPCLHMVTVVAQGDAGPSGLYRAQLRDVQTDSIYQMARSIGGIFFIDVQVGQDDIRNLMPRFEEFLKKPDIHFAVDPEFYMRGGVVPGRKIGTMTASDINYVTGELARIVRENNLPPKVLVIHRFTRNMVQGSRDIVLRPEVQIVMDMDGWGAPWLKRDSYRDYVVKEPVQFTGFKLFYHNDTKKGDPLMTPADLLKLPPKPLYIQYQ
ncbi:MAG TPA: hypothetical protein VHG51_12860, partial [Longimicrobiaceae bacterium]|nr:hypothetical protein [Longimicrobiaceae bacterium]